MSAADAPGFTAVPEEKVHGVDTGPRGQRIEPVQRADGPKNAQECFDGRASPGLKISQRALRDAGLLGGHPLVEVLTKPQAADPLTEVTLQVFDAFEALSHNQHFDAC